MSSSDYFDLKYLSKCFETSMEADKDIKLEPFLLGFQELNKFCDLMGGILFNAVSTEISSKSNILQEYLQKDAETFSSLQKMIAYERRENQLNNGVCGCRTLLRLLRGLDFVRTFFEKVSQLNYEDSTSSVGTEAYNQTLAQHHGFFVRQAASIGLWTLPSKKELLRKLFGDRTDEAMEALPVALKSCNCTYLKLHELFKSNNLLELP
ncbi:ceramide-1-phosphate transfer protein-like [Cimex lectularius]|uniref:Glycolipid transfer protein domain-containing protein n=1 Tax=Cimex lectularius TaxID=79782 RepID=A0A8I6S2G6_CIMLE|nr:ceramide-1-phosphate transfer protein-like [Cimex lectularius]